MEAAFRLEPLRRPTLPFGALSLRWCDIDWERGRIVVRSPKTEHHDGKEHRVIPLFPELRPYLEAVRDEVNPGIDVPFSDPVITRYRDTNANLRTQLLRIIAKAKVAPWPKLFQNLRASRATELAAEYPAHVAAEWLGHSTAVAQKHYWQVTDADYDQAPIRAANALQQPTETSDSAATSGRLKSENRLTCENLVELYASNQYPQGDSNPCRRRERAVSWASRRWGPCEGGNCRGRTADCKLRLIRQLLEQRRQGDGETRSKQSPAISLSPSALSPVSAYDVIPFVSAMNAVSRFSSSSRNSVSLWPAPTSSVARSL